MKEKLIYYYVKENITYAGNGYEVISREYLDVLIDQHMVFKIN